MTTFLHGFGVFERDRDRSISHARRMHDATVRWVGLMAEAEDGYVAKPDVLAAQSEIYQRAGLLPWVWSFPGEKAVLAPEKAALRLGVALRASGALGAILDIEVAFKGKPEECARFVRAVIDQLTEKHNLAISSFPIRAYHPTLPWEEMVAGVGMPQLYETAASRALARRAIAEWRENARVICPVLAAYDTKSPGEGAQQLAADLPRVLLNDDGVCDVAGASIWSAPQLDAAECRVMAEWSAAHGW